MPLGKNKRTRRAPTSKTRRSSRSKGPYEHISLQVWRWRMEFMKIALGISRQDNGPTLGACLQKDVLPLWKKAYASFNRDLRSRGIPADKTDAFCWHWWILKTEEDMDPAREDLRGLFERRGLGSQATFKKILKATVKTAELLSDWNLNGYVDREGNQAAVRWVDEVVYCTLYSWISDESARTEMCPVPPDNVGWILNVYDDDEGRDAVLSIIRGHTLPITLSPAARKFLSTIRRPARKQSSSPEPKGALKPSSSSDHGYAWPSGTDPASEWKPPPLPAYNPLTTVAKWKEKVSKVLRKAQKEHVREVKLMTSLCKELRGTDKIRKYRHLECLADYQVGGLGTTALLKKYKLGRNSGYLSRIVNRTADLCNLPLRPIGPPGRPRR
jgi:hypothetical protein